MESRIVSDRHPRRKNVQGTGWSRRTLAGPLRVCGLVLLSVAVIGQVLLWNAPSARAVSTGAVWGTPVIADGTGLVGSYNSLAIVNGNPAICYRDAVFANGDLKYVRATDADGTIWAAPVTVDATGDVGKYTSLAIVNGNPAISYFDVSNGDLKYAQATDADGTIWATPVTVDATGSVGQYTSLAIVNGNPAISYSDDTNGDLKYVRATDANGMTWATPVIAGSVGWHTSLAIVNGNPAISYFDLSNGNLKYVRATDANGTTWATPVTAASVGAHTSLAIVNGNPAISYSDASDANLKYVRATDADGTIWATPVTVDAPGDVGRATSLAIVSGNPAISYYDTGNRDLKYARATDANGSVWATPVTVDAPGSVGAYTSLAIVGGNPAISYSDVPSGDLKYVRALDDPNVAAEDPAECLSLTNTCVTVPILLNRVGTADARAASVTIQLSSELVLCTPALTDITMATGAGSWFDGYTNTLFYVTDNGGGSYTIDSALDGLPCGPAGGGYLFNVEVAKAASVTTDATGTVSVTEFLLRDCDNVPLAAIPGASATINIDLTAPAVLTGLSAAQVKASNDSDGTTKINLSWDDPGGDATAVEIWRQGYGDYPEYDDGTGAVPPATIDVANGWTLVNTVAPTPTTYDDEPVDRDFYYHAAIVVDGCGNKSLATAMTGGTLNYHLADVVDGLAPPAVDVGDNLVDTADFSLLGFNYGISLTTYGQAENILDVGPTSDFSVNALPTTDDRIQFEDLMMFAINSGQVGKVPAHPAAAAFSEIVLSHGNADVVGSTFEVEIRMQGDGQVQGLSVPLRWDSEAVSPTTYRAGDLLAQQGGSALVLSPEPGAVDAALFGVRDAGICGEGVLAVVTFKTLSTGDPGIALGEVSARDAKNQPVVISGRNDQADVPALVPQVSELRAAVPNPFNPSTTLSFALSRTGQVKLQIYSMRGHLVRTLADEQLTAGRHERIWDGTDGAGRTVSSGTYLVRMSAPDLTQSRQITLLK